MGTPKLALLWATKREILRSVLRFFPLKCGLTCHLQVAAPCTLYHQTLNTERPEHRRDLSVEALEAWRPQRPSNLVAARGRAKRNRT